jgi:hypothetical protein
MHFNDLPPHQLGTIEIISDQELISERNNFFCGLSEEVFNKMSERLELYYGAILAQSYDTNGLLRGSLLLNDLHFQILTRDTLRQIRYKQKGP